MLMERCKCLGWMEGIRRRVPNRERALAVVWCKYFQQKLCYVMVCGRQVCL